MFSFLAKSKYFEPKMRAPSGILAPSVVWTVSLSISPRIFPVLAPAKCSVVLLLWDNHINMFSSSFVDASEIAFEDLTLDLLPIQFIRSLLFLILVSPDSTILVFLSAVNSSTNDDLKIICIRCN